MKKYLLIAAVAAAGIAAASPAYAAVEIKPGASVVQPEENILLNIDRVPGDNTVRGTTNQTSTIALFSSSTDKLISPPQGQAFLVSGDGNLNELTFSLEGSTFTELEFNIDAGFGGSVLLSAFGIDGTSQTFTVDAAGSNFFGVIATGESRISSFTIATLGGTDIDSIGQFRVGGVMAAAVPEPATWAMMLFGFGAVGYSMRSRKTSYRLAQAV